MTFVTTLLASACHLLRVALRQHQYSSGSVIGNWALCVGFFPWQVNIAVVRWGFCADYMVKFASPSCVRFISFGFLLATTCVWVWMVCSLHSVTTGSRDRANVSLIIITYVHYIYIGLGLGLAHSCIYCDQPSLLTRDPGGGVNKEIPHRWGKQPHRTRIDSIRPRSPHCCNSP